MNVAEAQQIVRLAAPIYAALLGRAAAKGEEVPATALAALRKHAILQAQALWLDALEASEP